MKLLALPALVAASCISVPPAPGAMCKQTSECASGEVCQEGVCWGDPPGGTFAATLVPSGDRTDLVATEVSSLVIPQNGWLDHVPFATPLTIAGRVEAYCAPTNTTCAGTSVGATITITRPSAFPGGPGFRALVTAKDGVARGADSFSALVPPSGSGDLPLSITVVPDGGGPSPPTAGSSPAMLAPPLHTTLDASGSANTTFVLGSADTRTIDGTLSDGLRALTRYRVVARARWDAMSPVSDVSTVAYTSDGTFHLQLADGVSGPFELVATPYDANTVAPTLEVDGIEAGATQAAIVQPPNVGNPLALTIPITGKASSGEVGPVSGARVIVTGGFAPMFTGTRADLTVEATTSDDGNAHVTVLDGSALRSSYQVFVVPPAGSNLGALYAVPLVLDPGTPVAQTVPMLRLPSRVALRATAVGPDGSPIAGLSVTARPSLRFQWSLDAAGQQFLADIPAATAVSSDTGDFSVWVDPNVAGVWGHYDLAFEPASGSESPSWLVPDVEIPRVQTQTTVSLAPVTIPAASHVHGVLVDPSGGPVSGADLRIFEISTDSSLCSQVPHPPADCVIPARLVGHGTSDDAGIVRLTLPHP